MKNLKNTSFLILFIFLASCTGNLSAQKPGEEIEVTKIWGEAPHSAFTDLLRFKNAFYCTFREGTTHVKGWDGKARVIKSTDGKNWTSVALLKMDGRDVRDPKISVTPDNRIMVLMDVEANDTGKVISRKPYVSYSDKSGGNFSLPSESTVDAKASSWSNWVWRVTWNNGVGYAINYQPDGVFLVKTKDGTHFDYVSKIDIDGYPNESTVRFDKKGKCYVMIRREQKDKMGVLATSNAPYQDWTINYMNQRLGGPNFFFLNDTTLCIGSRLYPSEASVSAGNSKAVSAIFIADLKGNVNKIIEIPSGGDCSYPGMVIYDKKLWYSYYSSHEGKTSIFLAKIPMNKLKM
ncbi:MAG: hypothetical protein ABIN89_12880 [Chitinophagaceae bacterium]